MAAPFIEGDRIGISAIARNDPRFQLDQRNADAYRIFRMLVAVIQPTGHI